MKYVQFVRGRYLVRVTVPPELRGVVGKREFSEPLGADKKVAERRAHGVIAGFLAQLEEARERLEASKPTLGSAAKAHYRAELEADDRERTGTSYRSVKALNQWTRPYRASKLRLIAAGQSEYDEAEALLGDALDDLVARGLAEPFKLRSYARADSLRALAEVQLDALARFEERDRGVVYPGEPRSELLLMPEADTDQKTVGSPRKQAGGASLSDVLAAFHKERTAGSRSLALRTMEEHKVAVRMFEEFIGSAVSVRSIARADVLAYKQALLQTPSRYTLRFPGLTLPQAIKANEKRKEPFQTLDPATINMKWLSHLSTILRWASNNGYIEANPAVGVRVDEGNGFKERSRVPFTQDDLKRIFGSDLFKEPDYKTKQWALLLALYTGARSSSEIARIRLRDVYEEQGIPVIMLAMASKNQHSKRLVPIHAHLIDRGLLKYVELLRNAGETRLFPDWEPEDKINRWFLRSYRSEVGINDPRKVFHSFRHTLKTALARYGVNRDVSDLITGHKDQSVGGIYIGDASTTMVKAMAEGLNRVEFHMNSFDE